MKCHACGKSFSLGQWRIINLSQSSKTTIKTTQDQALVKKTPISYYTVPGKHYYNNIYACPFCGTLRITGPTYKN